MDHLRENLEALEVRLTERSITAAGQVLNAGTVHGARYNAVTLEEIDTEAYATVG